MKPLKLLSYKKNSKISKLAKVYPFSIVLDSSIDDFSYLSYSCTIHNCTIGKFCSIGKGVKIGLGKHPIDRLSTSPVFYSISNPLKNSISIDRDFNEFEQIKIGNDVWIGTNVTILDGVNVGNGVIIGANSVVTKDVPAYSILGGVPAKLIRKRFEEEMIILLEKYQWWNMPMDFYDDTKVKKIFMKEFDLNSLKELIKLMEIFNS